MTRCSPSGECWGHTDDVFFNIVIRHSKRFDVTGFAQDHGQFHICRHPPFLLTHVSAFRLASLVPEPCSSIGLLFGEDQFPALAAHLPLAAQCHEVDIGQAELEAPLLEPWAAALGSLAL
jgi:hypothetical protein